MEDMAVVVVEVLKMVVGWVVIGGEVAVEKLKMKMKMMMMEMVEMEKKSGQRGGSTGRHRPGESPAVVALHGGKGGRFN